MAAAFMLSSCTPAPEPPAPRGSTSVERDGSKSTHNHSGAPSVANDPSISTAAPDAGTGTETSWRSNERLSLLVRGGTVIDGSGRAPRRADVALRGAVIAHVGLIDDSVTADRVIDARNMVVTPGFIDAHSHGDPLGDNGNFVAMGVTTICVGQDGRSPAEGRI